MTMDEIRKLVDDFGRVSAVDGDADFPHSEAWIESRAALLRAVEGLAARLSGVEAERDALRDALGRCLPLMEDAATLHGATRGAWDVLKQARAALASPPPAALSTETEAKP